jgi:hypothetical protein
MKSSKSSRILVPALLVGSLAAAPFLRNALAGESLDATPTQLPPYPSGGPVPTPTPTPPPMPTPSPTPTPSPIAPTLDASIAPITPDSGM